MRAPGTDRRIAAERLGTIERQGRAADPAVSAWVSANAGTGKTHVLANRVLRLLIAGTPPERLLCLTYTKAAAAEMSSRVFTRLAGWVTAADGALAAELAALLGRPPDEIEAGRARDLFTAAIETPGGLKVETIHAFCERLLQRFPLEAGVPPGFEILDEETRAALIREATVAVLRLATAEAGSSLGEALERIVAFASDASFEGVLAEALGKRDWIEEARRLNLGEARDLEAAAVLYRSALGLRPGDSEAAIEAEMAAVLSDTIMRRTCDALSGGGKTDLAQRDRLAVALGAASPGVRIEAIASFLLTNDGEPRKSLMTAKLKAAHPDLDARLADAQAAIQGLHQKRGHAVLAEATIALLRLASAVMQRFHAAKQARAALDFDDLIRSAGNLLRFGEAAQWVLYKLDGGLDHILVDEAQDTSPTQWRVVEALAREFFAGAGSREAAPGAPRTVFAVGDEKQSIYGFQGAAPRMFADMGRRFEAMARASGLEFARVPLTLSFRSVAPILDAVDSVFEAPERARGLTASGEVARHVANRQGHGGLVEIWDTEKPDDSEPPPAWQPLDEAPASSPVSRLAGRVADMIAGWLASGEQLVSEGRPIRAGDILILVRKRRPFADEMVAALKARGVAVAGADRLRLTDQLAVLDLIALGRFLLLPEDDLALANVLKSPLGGLDDDDLTALAPSRRGSLWSALLAAGRAAPEGRLAAVAERLKRWRSRADVMPPYEVLVEVLTNDGMRERLLARLGPEAADPLDELLGLALAYDEEAAPSLQGFIDWLGASSREIKRDMEHGRDEVRVMTVHGSKGLEAPVVILPDTCSGASSNRPRSLLAFPDMLRPNPEPEPFLWPVKDSSSLEAVRSARGTLREREAEEHSRLLYVALTRARDRTYVAGFEGVKGRASGCWYDTILTGLEGRLAAAVDAAGRPVWRLAAGQVAAPELRREDVARVIEARPLPMWATTPAPREVGLAVPLAPSRLAPIETDAEGDPVEAPGRTGGASTDGPPAPSPRALADGSRFLRGTITHGLLQHLPGLPRAEQDAAARRFVAARGTGLRPALQASIVAETLAVLADPVFAPVFGPGSRAEVPVAALIPSPAGKGQPVSIAGQIDRLVVTDHDVLIVDFKTNRPPPRDVAMVADAYVLQLAAYRLAISRIFAPLPVRAALLWTDGPRLMELPAERLDEAAGRLFKGVVPSLDAP